MTHVDSDRVRGMVTELDSAGSLPAEYHSAFLATAREWFVPDQFWFKANENGNDAALDRGTDPDGWLSTVYSDTALVTQFDDGDTAWPDVGYRPTSSASMPSVVAGMLRALDVHSGHFVLEIGTGTGWNAALLAEIVGAQGLVVTVEVDDNLGSLARERLATAGYSAVDVRIADASKPLEDDQMFDRVIATAGVHIGRFPYWWVESTRPGGVIVAPMRVDMSAGPLVRFVVNEDGTATGHAVSWLQVGFMDMRAHRIPDADVESLRWDDPDADVSTSDLAPWVPLLADDHRWPIAVALPSCQYEVWKHTEQRPHGIAWLHDVQSGSWASVVPAGSKRYTVRQSGPRRLWDEAEAAYRWWQQRGEPPLSAWRWTITPDRRSITLESGD